MHSRLRFLPWLTLLLPIAIGGMWVSRAIDRDHERRVAASLDDALRLESTRLLDQLSRYADTAARLAGNPALRTALQERGPERATPETPSDAPATALGNTPGDEQPDNASLQTLAERLLDAAKRRHGDIVAVHVVDRNGRSLGAAGRTAGEPPDAALIEAAGTTRRPSFGPVTGARGGQASWLPIAVPVTSRDARVIGVLILHGRLTPLITPLLAHHALGESTEVYLVQNTGSGEHVPISALRFPPAGGVDETVRRLVPSRSAARATRTVDYRGVETMAAVRTLAPTGWTLVARIARAEADAPLLALRRAALAALAVAALALLATWLLIMRPLLRRMRRTATAAERMSHGQHENPINDLRDDRIGDVARSIDRLATDLDSDRRQRALAEARLRHQSMHDDLTGLVNRRQAHAVIDTLSETPSRIASLVFLDLDAFKTVNDLHGHAVGDEVLVALSRRLESAIDTDATLARWGGDQFLVILPDTSAEDAQRVAGRVRTLFEHPVGTSAGQHRLDCGLGVSTSTEQRPLHEMLGEVEAAMSAEKRHRQTAGSVDAFAARAVRNALEERRVELWVQPIVQVPTPGRARPVGAEALVRLRSREGGIIPPADFLSAVRKTPLGRTLDGYMMERCTEALARWRRAGVVDDSFRLSINITGASLREPSLADDLGQRLTVQGVPAANLIIEISEKTGDVDERLLDNLRQLGVGIALDDVGLEHSNIDRLVALSPDIAKLDRQWLDDPVVLPRLIDLCRELGMQLIAEGVETHAQLARLQALSVSSFQGYLFDRPRPAVQFVERWGRLSGTSRPTGGDVVSEETLSVVG